MALDGVGGEFFRIEIFYFVVFRFVAFYLFRFYIVVEGISMVVISRV